MKKQKQMKRLDVVVKYFYPVVAGIETNILETYSNLVKRGWKVTIHTSNLDYTTGEKLPAMELVRGLKVKRYPLKWYGFTPKINWKSVKLLCLHNFDMPLQGSLLFKISLVRLFSRKKFRVVLTPHGGFTVEWSIYPFWQRVIKKFYNKTFGIFLINANVDTVRAVSEWEKRELVRSKVKKSAISIISNGLEDEAFINVEKEASDTIKKKVKNLGKYIIQIGRIYPIKNYETVIKALPDISNEVKFVILGPTADKKYLSYLKTLSKKLRVENRVLFLGVIHGVDKYYLIKKAQLMVHMALWESFCNVVHEGMSQGKICIVANNTALPLLIKNEVNGYCVETKNNKKVAEKVNFVLKNKGAYKIIAMEKLNRKEGLKNSWVEVAEKMHDLYSFLYKRNSQTYL